MLLKREYGQEHPYWPMGPFKVRLPFIHFKWAIPETIQAMVMFVISLGMIPLLEQYLGVPYEVGLAFVVVCGIGFILPPLLGVPFIAGWITPAIPVVLLFIGQYEPGPDAMRAMVALQLMVTAIFLFMAVTRLGSKLVNNVPSSIKAGILLGAGIAAISGEIVEGGRLYNTPISLGIGGLITLYVLFSLSFRDLAEKYRWARNIVAFGMVPGMLITMAIGWGVGEYGMPTVEWGIAVPDFASIWAYLPFSIGAPPIELMVAAIPTAIIAYIIAFGDIVVGQTLLKRVDHLRPDEKIEVNVDRVHLITGIRNLMHSLLAPTRAWPARCSPAAWPP